MHRLYAEIVHTESDVHRRSLSNSLMVTILKLERQIRAAHEVVVPDLSFVAFELLVQILDDRHIFGLYQAIRQP